MPSVINWTMTRNELANALAAPELSPSAPSPAPPGTVLVSPAKIYGDGVLAQLDAHGAAYDRDNGRLRARQNELDQSYSDALAAWVAKMGVVWGRAVKLCRYLEGEQYTYQSTRQAFPRIAISTAGEKFPLAVDTLPFPAPFADPDPPTRASVYALDDNGRPVVRIEAREIGIAGNLVTASTTAATNGKPNLRNVVIQRGSGATAFVETYENLNFAEPRGTGSQDESLLVLPFVRIGYTIPAVASPANLSGGTGNVLDALAHRLELLATLPVGESAIRAEELAFLNETLAELDRVWAEKPRARNLLEQREAELTAALVSAQRIALFLTSGLAW